jgi:hypothetical protein
MLPAGLPEPQRFRDCLMAKILMATLEQLNPSTLLAPRASILSRLKPSLSRGSTASKEVQHKQHYANQQSNVNEPTGYVEREHPQEPHNNQNRCEHSQH